MCVRGASALGDVLAAHPEANIRVMVIWLPVIPSDQGPPARKVRKPLRDPRVIEFWDENKWASPKMIERATMMARARGEEPDFEPDAIAWDLIGLFPAGVGWEEPFPTPSWWGAPVVDSLEPVEEHLRNVGHGSP